MKINIKKIVLPAMATAMAITLGSCVDEATPVNYVTPADVAGMASSQKALLDGIVSYVIDYNSWGSTSDEYYTNDWGYPCQMMYRDALTADFTPVSSGYNYWAYVESSVDLKTAASYSYNYYCRFIKNCNNLIAVVNPDEATETSLGYLGCALTFRAMCYLDMARMFEFQKTGYTSLDNRAADVLGLTVPIVTEKTTDAELRNNSRVPYYTMYRFILTDLNDAVEYLENFEPSNGTYPSQAVAYGLLARLWLEMGTRFDLSPSDLSEQLSHESDESEYDKLGISTATDCFKNASEYAQKAAVGYTPMSADELHDSSTAFNTATDSWMLYGQVSTIEQQGNYYSSLMGTICTEAYWGMCQYGGGNYRCMGSWLYDKMNTTDTRRTWFIDPDDAGKTPDASNELASKYQLATWQSADGSVTSNTAFANYPVYTNLKYRTRNCLDQNAGMMCDIPMMRVEEMLLIDAEATARVEGVAAGIAKLNAFMQTYRDASYNCTAVSIDDFVDEVFIQKRIELWGEGLSMFDYKRLKKAVLRTLNTNIIDAYMIDSKEGYVCPALNYYILDYEKDQNPALIQNPDCTGWNTLE